MEKNFTNENFESFLRQNAGDLRMRPTDKVWKGISKHLNRRKRRIGFAAGSLLLVASSLGYYLITSPVKNFQASVSTTGIESIGNKNSFEKVVDDKLNPSTSLSNDKVSSIFTNKNLASQNKVVFSDKQATLNNVNTTIVYDVNTAVFQNEFIPTVTDSYFPAIANEYNRQSDKREITSPLPLSIESVINLYKPKQNKVTFQVFFAPTISYRKLGENKSYLRSQPLNTIAASTNVKSEVTHKPSVGFEAGFTAKYPISKKMKLRAGLQFNINRFNIKASTSTFNVATIRLNSRGNTPDSLRTITRYSNTNSPSSEWLQNFYFQVSAPVGVEFKIHENDKMQFGIATTIQPTYIIGDKAYVISTNYKNYAQVPDLIRRWNVATSFETFVAYSTGHLSWQVGPQVRYQLLSSFISKYPVKENLFDFGLKVGISLNK